MTTKRVEGAASPIRDHDARVAEFRKDLSEQNTQDVIRKHITTGDPIAVDKHTYYDLRRRVAMKFNLHPSAVILVGSCRTGFSLKPNKRYLPVSDASDVDVAVVSPPLFDAYWDNVFHRSQDDPGWARNAGKRFATDLFRGWITPRDLPNLPRSWTGEFGRNSSTT